MVCWLKISLGLLKNFNGRENHSFERFLNLSSKSTLIKKAFTKLRKKGNWPKSNP